MTGDDRGKHAATTIGTFHPVAGERKTANAIDSFNDGENNYLFIETPVNFSGSPQGFLQVRISHKLNAIQNMHIIYKRKTYKHNRKVSPFGIALV